MELIIIITLLSIFFSAQLPTSSSSSSHIQFQPQGAVHVNQQFPLPTLPRKLIRLTEKVEESNEAKYLASHKQKDSLPAGKQYYRKQNMVVGNRGTRQEWMEEGDDPSQYFSMDYTRVKRRRPIHNKQLPVGP